jgi:hypothetical protein
VGDPVSLRYQTGASRLPTMMLYIATRQSLTHFSDPMLFGLLTPIFLPLILSGVSFGLIIRPQAREHTASAQCPSNRLFAHSYKHNAKCIASINVCTRAFSQSNPRRARRPPLYTFFFQELAYLLQVAVQAGTLRVICSLNPRFYQLLALCIFIPNILLPSHKLRQL